MQIEFKKIPTTDVHFEVSLEDIVVSGNATKIDKTMVRLDGTMRGLVVYACDRCGAEFNLKVDEKVEVFASDGLYEDQNGEDLLNIVEFFDGSINFDTILQSELEALKSDYHYCGDCEQIQGV